MSDANKANKIDDIKARLVDDFVHGCGAGAVAGGTISALTGGVTLPAGLAIGCATGALYGIGRNATDVLNAQHQFIPTRTPACDKSSGKCPDM